MTYTSKKIFELPVDTGAIWWCTYNELFDDVDNGLSFYSSDHLKGNYRFYIEYSNGRPGTVYLIHEKHADSYLKSINKQNFAEYKYDMPVDHNLLISDPCYVCDKQIKTKKHDVDEKKIYYWGRDEKLFTKYLDELGISYINRLTSTMPTAQLNTLLNDFYELNKKSSDCWVLTHII
jgi:hypothetical protein